MRILKASLPALGQTLLLGSLFLQIALAQTPPLPSPWAPMGPTDATVLSLRRDPFDPGVLFVGTFFGGLYKSVDRGATWSHVNSPFTSTSVFSIAADRTLQGTFYVGTLGKGVYETTDGGTSWVAKSQGLTDPTVLVVAVSPSDSNRCWQPRARGSSAAPMEEGPGHCRVRVSPRPR